MQNISLLNYADCNPRDSFEEVVELYYQSKGYITSSNKWFASKKDLDVLAINQHETLLISVKTKFREHKNIDELKEYFSFVENELVHINEYKWLIDRNTRKIKHILAYIQSSENILNKLPKDVETVDIKDIFTDFKRQLDSIGPEGWKCENTLVKMIYWINRYCTK